MEEQLSTLDHKTQEKKTPEHAFDPAYLSDMLKVYYKRLFPHKAFYRWLSYGSCKFVSNNIKLCGKNLNCIN